MIGRMTRRGLVATGGAAVAALWLGPEWSVVDGVAEAATRDAWLRRSGWLQVTDGAIRAHAGAHSARIRVASVEDLPLAAHVPALRDHDAAFTVMFAGDRGLEQGMWRLEHSELGTFELFVVPVGAPDDGGAQRYEAVIDRTVLVAGHTDPGPTPEPAPTAGDDVRAVLPGVAAGVPFVAPPSAVPSTVAAAPSSGPTRPHDRRRPARPRLRRITFERASRRRILVVETLWSGAAEVVSIHALLVARKRVVARAGGPVRRAGRVRLRMRGRRPLAAGRYELRLTVVERGGRVTRLRRSVRIR